MSEAVPLAERVQPVSTVDLTVPEQEADAFAAASPGDPQPLIDDPCRTLEVEYKGWRNLGNPEDRAELARDIAALANHGGGTIVFGFCRETLAPEDTHPFRTRCTNADVAGVVRDYLDPPVRCSVATLRSAAGNLHTVIRVASHGAIPVCIVRDGPLAGTDRIVERGAIYVRKYSAPRHGRHIGTRLPESGRIATPQDWAALIRRCVCHDRAVLLALVDSAIQGRRPDPTLEQRIRAWHDAAHAAFLALVPRSPFAEQLRRGHFALSYGFELADRRVLDRAQLPELLRLAAFEQRTMFPDILNMFDPPYRRAVQPRFVVDAAVADEQGDVLEVAWLRERMPGETADFWRFAPSGLATILRDYAEDRNVDGSPQMRAGRWFSPNALAQEIAELVWHARILARLFGSVRRVGFRCEWWGLAGRELFDPAAPWVSRGAAAEDHRVACLQVPASSLAEGWAEVVAHLMAPALRGFAPELALDADWVRGQAARWQGKVG